MLTYAVGDIHGRLDLLDEILAKIEQHCAGRPHRIVCVGDYIDRGPDSAGVIARLRGMQAAGADLVCLMGNHEDLLLRALARPEVAGNWLMNGGGAALESWGVDRPEDIPPDDVAWIRALPTWFTDERRYFVHAGLKPGVPLDQQTDHDRLWIRDAFFYADFDLGLFVVHGHTPRSDGCPELRPYRVNIDTGAVYGGRLTAAVFEDGQDAPVGFLLAPA